MITLGFISRRFLCGLLTVCLLCAAVLPAEAADVNGHKKEKGIDSFDRYLEENGLKEGLLSTDTDKNSDAFLDLVYRLFDSGHDDVQLDDADKLYFNYEGIAQWLKGK